MQARRSSRAPPAQGGANEHTYCHYIWTRLWSRVARTPWNMISAPTGHTSGVVGAICKYTPYAYFFPRAVCVLRLLRINICIYPLVLLLRKSVIYCSFPYNAVPYSCVKLMILCCNWFIITSVILPFPAHHRLSARVRCIERTPLNAAFVFLLRAGRAYWPSGAPGHSRWIDRVVSWSPKRGRPPPH